MNGKKFEYKWVIAAICTLMVFCCLGFCNSAKSLYIGPVTEAFGIERTLYSLTDTIRYLSTAAANMFFGKLLYRFGTKKLIGAGILLVSLASLIFATAPNVYIYFIGSLLLGIGFAFTTTTMAGAVVNKWFKSNQGSVMGFILASSGLGGAVASKILAPVIESSYRKSYFLCVAITVAMLIVAMIFFKENPPESDDTAEETPQKAKKVRNIKWEGIEYSEATKKTYFYVAVILIFLSGVALQGMSGSAAVHIKDVFENSQLLNASDFAATTLAIGMLALACAKFLTGFLYDKFGLRVTVIVSALSGVIVLLMLSFLTDSVSGVVLSYVYSILSAVALPMETVLIPLYASDLLGEKSFTRAMGVFAAVNTAGFALGAPIINGFYDAFGSYKYGYIMFAIFMFIVLVGFQFVISAAHKERKKLENK